MWLYSLSLAFEFAALIRLRQIEPDLHRPYKIPLSTCGIILICIAPFICCVALLCLSTLFTWIACGAILISGILLWLPYNWVNKRPLLDGIFPSCCCCFRRCCKKSVGSFNSDLSNNGTYALASEHANKTENASPNVVEMKKIGKNDKEYKNRTSDFQVVEESIDGGKVVLI